MGLLLLDRFVFSNQKSRGGGVFVLVSQKDFCLWGIVDDNCNVYLKEEAFLRDVSVERYLIIAPISSLMLPQRTNLKRAKRLTRSAKISATPWHV